MGQDRMLILDPRFRAIAAPFVQQAMRSIAHERRPPPRRKGASRKVEGAHRRSSWHYLEEETAALTGAKTSGKIEEQERSSHA